MWELWGKHHQTTTLETLLYLFGGTKYWNSTYNQYKCGN